MLTSFALYGIEYEEYWNKQLDILVMKKGRTMLPQDNETLCFLLPRLNMTQEQFIETFITPWKSVDIATARQIAEVMSNFSDRYFQQPVELTVAIKEERELRGLEWLTVFVNELNLNEFEQAYSQEGWVNTTILRPKKPIKFNKKPFQQCHFCGRLDTDPRGKKFTAKSKFCHGDQCPGDSSNPEAHDKKNCCYRHWGLIKKSFRQKLNRIVERNEDNQDQQIREALNDFYRRMFEHGKRLAWDVRDKDECDSLNPKGKEKQAND